MKTRFIFFLFAITVTACSPQSPNPTPTPTPIPTAPPSPTATPEWMLAGWNLVWQDEFDGDEVNRDDWAFDLGRGAGGWGNHELQWYTDRPENVRLEDGILIIEAREEEFIRSDYTSGRMKTEGLQAWQFGRVEARIQIPTGQGIWPAFWMLGTEGGNWPNIGEIDIMENIGREPNKVHGTVHGPGYSGANGVGTGHTLTAEPFADDFHIFAVEWEPDAIRWYVDDNHYNTITPDDVPGDWVYDDHPFFLILNVAVGGDWPGSPNETTTFPQQMLVDYIRVYQSAGEE
ncbi:MAG: glycoside hydrolase family 16 protein [Chloroflexi bacterium]|nr:glycoside hydrolase family 16 protein [Chloroflexota bacterium]